MRPRVLLFRACLFSIATLVAGGCDRRIDPSERRTPRTFDATRELFVIDAIDATKGVHVVSELGIESTPAPTRTVPPRRSRERKPELAPTTEVMLPEFVQAPPASATPPAVPVSERLPPQTAREPALKTVPVPAIEGAHETAIHWTVAIGALAIGLGTSPAIRGDAPGERIFALSALGVGVASLSTALVLYLTEPRAKPMTISLAPGGLAGTF